MADLWRLKGSQFFNQNGNPLAGGKFRYYDAATTNPRAVYKNSTAATLWTQPIDLDADGRLTDSIYIVSGAFKEKQFTAAEVEVYSEDNIPGAVAVVTLVYALPQTPVITKASDYSVVVADLGSLFLTNATGGDFTLTLPSAVTAGNGAVVLVQQVGSGGKTTIASVGGQTINGAASVALTRQYSGLTLTSDGANWAAVGTDFQFTTLSKTTTYTVAVADYGKLIKANATGGGFNINLPAASSAGDGFRIGVKKTDATTNAVTIDGNASETIDGATTYANTDYQLTVWLRCDGTNWQVESGGPLVATTTARGPLEIATDAEAIAKASGARALVPSNLAAMGSSDTFAGLVELATTAETQARSDTTRAVTPAGLGAATTPDYQPFILSGTWTKPSGVTASSRTLVEGWGAGGSSSSGRGGGGGGAYNAQWFLTSALTSTVTVTVATAPSAGAAGGNSTFGAFLTAYGGGGMSGQGGGGGGGLTSVGSNGSGTAGGAGGLPAIGAGAGGAGAGSAGNGNAGGGGGGSGLGNGGYGSFWGGGAGSGDSGTGGAAVFGGGGGGNANGGVSVYGGNGGANGANGTAPAGGGGANGGLGARGEIRVTTFI